MQPKPHREPTTNAHNQKGYCNLSFCAREQIKTKLKSRAQIYNRAPASSIIENMIHLCLAELQTEASEVNACHGT